MSENSKDTNPKDAVGSSKLAFSVLPCQVLGEVALGLMEGDRKYARHNYRVAGVRASIYYDACFRHLMAWWEGEDIDPDSGLNHVTKAIAGLVVLRDSMIMENWVDDRPPRSKQGWIQKLNVCVKDLIKRYPKREKPYTEINKNDKR